MINFFIWIVLCSITLSQKTNLDSSKLKKIADDNFESDEIEKEKYFQWVENTVGKGETARYEQFFSFSHSVFKRFVLQTCKNQGLFGKGLSLFLFFYKKKNEVKNST